MWCGVQFAYETWRSYLNQTEIGLGTLCPGPSWRTRSTESARIKLWGSKVCNKIALKKTNHLYFWLGKHCFFTAFSSMKHGNGMMLLSEHLYFDKRKAQQNCCCLETAGSYNIWAMEVCLDSLHLLSLFTFWFNLPRQSDGLQKGCRRMFVLFKVKSKWNQIIAIIPISRCTIGYQPLFQGSFFYSCKKNPCIHLPSIRNSREELVWWIFWARRCGVYILGPWSEGPNAFLIPMQGVQHSTWTLYKWVMNISTLEKLVWNIIAMY